MDGNFLVFNSGSRNGALTRVEEYKSGKKTDRKIIKASEAVRVAERLAKANSTDVNSKKLAIYTTSERKDPLAGEAYKTYTRPENGRLHSLIRQLSKWTQRPDSTKIASIIFAGGNFDRKTLDNKETSAILLSRAENGQLKVQERGGQSPIEIQKSAFAKYFDDLIPTLSDQIDEPKQPFVFDLNSLPDGEQDVEHAMQFVIPFLDKVISKEASFNLKQAPNLNDIEEADEFNSELLNADWVKTKEGVRLLDGDHGYNLNANARISLGEYDNIPAYVGLFMKPSDTNSVKVQLHVPHNSNSYVKFNYKLDSGDLEIIKKDFNYPAMKHMVKPRDLSQYEESIQDTFANEIKNSSLSAIIDELATHVKTQSAS